MYALKAFFLVRYIFTLHAYHYPILILGLFAITTIVVRTCQNRKQTGNHNCRPPPSYPHLDPFFGTDALLRFFKALWQYRLMDEINSCFNNINGGIHTFSINFLGSTAIYTMEPENVKTVFATSHRHYAIPRTRKEALGIFGPGIFTSDGEHWEASRALLRPNFVRSQLDTKMMEVHVAALINSIPKDGTATDLVELFSDLTMDTATELFLGESTHLLQGNQEPKALRFNEAFGFVSEKLSIRMGVGWLANVVPDRKFDKGVEDLKEFIGIYVQRALDLRQKISGPDHKFTEESAFGEGNRYVFLPELAKSGYNKTRIAAELMNVITAGRGSITSLLTVFWFTIARQPQVFERLKREVRQVLGDRPPTFEELKSLKYLGWTLRERKLRLSLLPKLHEADNNSTKIIPSDTCQFQSCSCRHNSSTRRGR